MEQSETSEVIFVADYAQWWKQVDPSKISEETRYRILTHIVEKYGANRCLKKQGLVGYTMAPPRKEVTLLNLGILSPCLS